MLLSSPFTTRISLTFIYMCICKTVLSKHRFEQTSRTGNCLTLHNTNWKDVCVTS
uniref:Uncharacterized protein n=1 Tax=Anguilla anguilla TaxID=7936 RepID=A0A0E9XNM8_ANGAN